MHFNILTIFPEMFPGTLGGGEKIGILDGFQNFGAGDIMELDNGEMILFRGADVDMNAGIINI